MYRKIFSLVIAAICMFAVETASAQFRYGATVGADMTKLHFKQPLLDVKKNFGGTAGVVGELMFPGIGFGVDFGLIYEMRGAKLDLGKYDMWKDQGYGDERLTMHYLVVPFHLRFKYTRLNGFEDTLAPFVYAGPSIGFLAAHSKLDCFSFPVGELGVDFGIGAEIKRNWQVQVSYTHGFTYACKDKTLTNFSARNSSWNIGVTYFFSK